MERLIRQSKGGVVNGNIESFVSLKKNDNPYNTTKKNAKKHQGYQELLNYFETISDEEASVKDILEKTKCSSAQLWKEGRKDHLSIEIKLDNIYILSSNLFIGLLAPLFSDLTDSSELRATNSVLPSFFASFRYSICPR